MRDRLLTAWARGVTSRPILTLVLAGLFTIAAVAFTVGGLTFKSDRSDLIDPELPWQQRYAAFKQAFPRWDDAIVVVDRGQTDESRRRADQFVSELESRLARDTRFQEVTAGFPREQAPPGLILTQPIERVREVVERLSQVGPVLASPSLEGLVGLSTLGGTMLPASQRDGLRGLLERTAHAGETEPGRAPPTVLGLEEGKGVERLVSSTGRLATVLVSFVQPDAIGLSDVDAGVNDKAKGIAALREHLAALRATPELAMVEAGVTGVPVLESDETALSTRDATLASVLSLGFITLLMLIAYRGVVVPMLAVTSLLVGMAWSFGWATLAVGHLQLLSVTFASLLLGLGIDVAIHLIARLELVHADHDHLAPAIARAFRGVGPGIITASLTVAAAAGAMALTSFRGVAEMGIIAAGGIVLCTIAIMCCFPALLMLMRRPEQRLRTHDGGESRPYMGALGVLLHSKPALVLLIGVCGAGAAAWLASRVGYDTDLQKLMPTTTESVVWQKKLEVDDEKSVWHAVVVAKSDEEAAALTRTLRGLEVVSDVGGAGMLHPPADALPAKIELLRTLPDPGAFAPMGDAPPPSAAQIESLRAAAGSLAERWSGKDEALALAARHVVSLSDDQLDRAMLTYRADRAELMRTLRALRDASIPPVEALPASIRHLFAGEHGERLLRVYPTEDQQQRSVLNPVRLERFASAVLAAAPSATGPAIQIYESSKLITGAYVQAAVYALVTIVVLLLLDFGVSLRGVLDTACALVPVAGGGVLMLAVMTLAGVPLNFANMIVMPLIIGIGVGCGVHAVRRWRLQPHDPPPGLAGGSGRAITLTTLTTVIGFATMMTGEHRGIWSLGFVMSVGLLAVWAVTIFVLPSILHLRKIDAEPNQNSAQAGITNP